MAKLQLNLVLLYAGEGAAKALALLAFSHLGHTLGDENYGPLVLPLGVYFIFNQLLDAGLAPFGAREASRHPSRTRTLAARIAWLRSLIVAVALVLLAGIAAGLDRPDEVRQLTLFFGAALLPMPFIVNWAFESRDEMQVVAGSSFLRQVIFASGVFLFVEERADLWVVPLSEAAGLFGQAMLQQGFFRARIGAFLPLRGIRGAGSVLRESLPLGASTIFSALRWFTPLLALSVTVSEAEAAHFESGHRIVVAMHTFVWLYFVNLLPSFSRMAGSADKRAWQELAGLSMSFVAWVVVPGMLIVVALAPVLLTLIYGESFEPGIQPFQLMLGLVVFAFLSGHHRYSLIAFREQRAEMVASAGGFLVSAAGTFGLLALGELTPLHAAGALVAGELATLIAAATLVRLKIDPLAIVAVLVPAAVPGALAVGLSLALPLESPALQIAAVVVAYGAALAWVRPPFLHRLGRRG